MDSVEVKKMMLKIIDNFGMNGVKFAEVMRITHSTFHKKKRCY